MANELDNDMLSALEQALLAAGLLMPTTPAQVAYVESNKGRDPELPAHLQDVKQVLANARERRNKGPNNSMPQYPELARAARGLGVINHELEELLKKIREESEPDGHG